MQALAAWIDQAEERSRLTLEALADVDAGRVIDHQTVQAWAGSLRSEDFLGRVKEICGNEAILKLLDGEQVPLLDRRWRY